MTFAGAFSVLSLSVTFAPAMLAQLRLWLNCNALGEMQGHWFSGVMLTTGPLHDMTAHWAMTALALTAVVTTDDLSWIIFFWYFKSLELDKSGNVSYSEEIQQHCKKKSIS